MEEIASYQQVTSALHSTQSEIGAAECHGMFCGVLCANGPFNIEAMAAQMLGTTTDESGQAGQGAAAPIGIMLNATLAQLRSEEFDLRLLLPDDDTPLAERSRALGLWCQGFITGLSAGGVTRETKLQKDANELLLDFTNIARTLQDPESLADAGGEEEEGAFAEVEEYVRVGVMLINEELRGQQPDKQQVH